MESARSSISVCTEGVCIERASEEGISRVGEGGSESGVVSRYCLYALKLGADRLRVSISRSTFLVSTSGSLSASVSFSISGVCELELEL